jgi:hypothetical protein
MGRKCSICTHAERKAIDAALVAGTSQCSIAKRYHVLQPSLSRHLSRGHLSPALKALKVDREQAADATARDRLDALIDSAQAVLDAAMKDGRPAVALQAVGQLRPLIEQLGKVTGEWAPDPLVTINLLQHPEGQQAIQIVMAELAAQPEIRARIAERLQLEAGAAS